MKNVYVVIGFADDNPIKTWQANLSESLAVCRTYTKAYTMAKFLGKITNPDMQYKKSLEKLKQSGAVIISQKDNEEEKATIVSVKVY